LKFRFSFHNLSAVLEQFYSKIYNNVRKKENYCKIATDNIINWQWNRPACTAGVYANHLLHFGCPWSTSFTPFPELWKMFLLPLTPVKVAKIKNLHKVMATGLTSHVHRAIAMARRSWWQFCFWVFELYQYPDIIRNISP
jgi:hypothetical protein